MESTLVKEKSEKKEPEMIEESKKNPEKQTKSND